MGIDIPNRVVNRLSSYSCPSRGQAEIVAVVVVTSFSEYDTSDIASSLFARAGARASVIWRCGQARSRRWNEVRVDRVQVIEGYEVRLRRSIRKVLRRDGQVRYRG